MNNSAHSRRSIIGHSVISRILITTLIMGCAGCINISKDHTPRSYYVLSASDSSTPGVIPKLAENKPCLVLRTLSISPLFARKEFVYRLTDNQYESDYYNLFFTSPANMLREQLARKLSSADAYNFVLSNTTELTPEYSLEVYVTSLYGDFRDPEKPLATISLVAYLIRQHGDQNNLTLTRSYRNQQPLTKRTANQLIDGWNHGLDTLLTNLKNDITKVVQDQH